MLNEKYKKANFSVLILMVVYSCIQLVWYYIPYLLNVINFYNLDAIKYGIIGGYIEESFIQSNILHPFIYGVLGIIFSLCLIAELTICLLKKYVIMVLHITIIAQNTILLCMQAWSKYFVNIVEDIVIIDIKLWLVIVLIIAGIFIWLSTKQKMFYILFGIIIILQIINTFSLVSEYIASIYVPQVVLQCFSGIVIPILYCIFLILNHKKK